MNSTTILTVTELNQEITPHLFVYTDVSEQADVGNSTFALLTITAPTFEEVIYLRDYQLERLHRAGIYTSSTSGPVKGEFSFTEFVNAQKDKLS